MRGELTSFVLYGGFRKMLIMPEDLKYKLATFDDWNGDVLKISNEDNCYVKNDCNGKFQFLSIQFSLEKSSYATMLLRELVHMSTEFKNQVAMFEQIKNLSGEKIEEMEEELEEIKEEKE